MSTLKAFEEGLPEVRSPRLSALSATYDGLKRRVGAPMGPKAVPGAPAFGLVMARGLGANVWDVEGNRYVDLAAGFGSLLLGHAAPVVIAALQSQASTLLQSMGDLFSSDVRLQLMSAIAGVVPFADAQVILGQSGADAVTAALKTAVLYTGRTEFVAFQGAYHGLSLAPLALCGLRGSYRAPFAPLLGSGTHFVEYPDSNEAQSLAAIEQLLKSDKIAGVVLEPILGRGGVRGAKSALVRELHQLCQRYGTLLIADEIWTGLGRCGQWLASFDGESLACDIVCLGKGLGGGLPISACVSSGAVMSAWSRVEEVVDTSTFAGAPLACATALATLTELATMKLPERSASLGQKAKLQLKAALHGLDVEVRGFGLMLAVDLGQRPGAAVNVLKKALDRGVIVSTGGGQREVVVLTPPLTISVNLLEDALERMSDSVKGALA